MDCQINFMERFDLQEYVNELGGVFEVDGCEAVPFNHWKKDMEWAVLILSRRLPYRGGFFCARATTAREAVFIAMEKFHNLYPFGS